MRFYWEDKPGENPNGAVCYPDCSRPWPNDPILRTLKAPTVEESNPHAVLIHDARTMIPITFEGLILGEPGTPSIIWREIKRET